MLKRHQTETRIIEQMMIQKTRHHQLTFATKTVYCVFHQIHSQIQCMLPVHLA